MVLNPFRCKQYWVSSILERNTLLAKIQTNKKKLTLFSEGCWYPYRELQNYTFLIYRGIFLYVFGLTFEFSFLLTEGDSSPTLSGTYTSGRTLSKVSCFDFEMPLAKPTCRRSVQECLSWFWSSTNSSCILTLPQAETRLCLHIWLSLLSLQKDHWWMKSIYPKPSLPHTYQIQTMLRSAILLSTDLVQLLLCSMQKGSAERPSSNKIFRFFYFWSALYFPIQQNVKLGIKKWVKGLCIFNLYLNGNVAVLKFQVHKAFIALIL